MLLFNLLLVDLNRKRTYVNKKEKEIDAWSRLREVFFEAASNSYPHSEICGFCGQQMMEIYRCLDCMATQICKSCVIGTHRVAKLHKIEKWEVC